MPMTRRTKKQRMSEHFRTIDEQWTNSDLKSYLTVLEEIRENQRTSVFLLEKNTQRTYRQMIWTNMAKQSMQIKASHSQCGNRKLANARPDKLQLRKPFIGSSNLI